MTARSLFFAEPQTSIRSQMVTRGPAGLRAADALGMCGPHPMATTGGADPVGAAVLTELADGCEPCRGRHQLLR